MLITIRNDFHRTEARVRLPETRELSRSVAARVRRDLCGVDGCTCGGAVGERGPNAFTYTERPSGSVIVWPSNVHVFRRVVAAEARS